MLSNQLPYQHILIIGANGKTGSRVLDGLSSQYPQLDVKAASRSSEVVFDWQQPSTWQPALQGIDAVYVTYYPDLAVPAAPQDIRQFCNIAAGSGVQHITLLSGRGEDMAQQCEKIVTESGLNYTLVRASWFNQNFTEGFFKNFIDAGVIALPVQTIEEPFIDINDIAQIVIASLTQLQHKGQLYEVTGPELLTFADLANKFSCHLERPIRFESISDIAFIEMLKQAQVPDEAVELLKYLFSEVLDGRNAYLGNGVEQALGRQPATFDTFIQRNRAQFNVN